MAGLAANEIVGRYLIRELLGSGSFVSVYRAWDPIIERDVALSIHPGGEKNLDTQALFEFSATLVGQLEHPLFVPVLDAGIHHDRRYFVHRFIGGSLAQHRNEGALLPWDASVRYVVQIGEALDLLHRRGYVHCGVSPDNVLLDSVGYAYLSSFFVANRNDRSLKLDSFARAYAAPEIFVPTNGKAGNIQVRPQLDIWALAVTLYELLTGHRPYSVEAVGLATRDGLPELERPSSLFADIPPSLDAILEQCLEVDPQNRIGSCAELNALLSKLPDRRIDRPRVFISHASLDREIVETRIVRYLENRGIRTWYSEADVQTAAEWERSILGGLESCEWFVIAMSTRALASEWVKDELFWAIDNRSGHIIPVLIDTCEPGDFHIRLRRLQALDFRSDEASSRLKLVETLLCA